jgi:hypothetical protein
MKKIICIGALVAAALTGGYFANKNNSEKTYSKIPKNKEYEIKLGEGAREYFETGISRMRLAGALYSPKHLQVILEDADENKDACLDKNEALDLYKSVLNPEAPVGRLAFQYNGPESPPPAESIDASAKWRHVIAIFMDENKDRHISEDEWRRGSYKMASK